MVNFGRFWTMSEFPHGNEHSQACLPCSPHLGILFPASFAPWRQSLAQHGHRTVAESPSLKGSKRQVDVVPGDMI